MLSASAPIFGNLATATSRALAGLQRSVGRTLRSSDAVASLRDATDGGQFSYAARMEGNTRAKNAMLQGMQNAVTYVQMQAAGLLHAQQVYQRMSILSSQAMDPLLGNDQRQTLNEEFDVLKQDLEFLRTDEFQDKYLYDDMAAWTVQKIDFSDGFSDKTPHSGINPSSNRKYWEVTKDVLYTSGQMTLEMNGGGTGEQYIVKQGNNVIFDTGWKWNTQGNAYNYDFDRFVIDFAPGQNTTFEFTPLTPGDGTAVDGPDDTVGTADDLPIVDNGVYDNKPKYLSNFGLVDDGSDTGISSILGQKLTSLGNVSTNPSDGNSTEVTVYVEATSIFQLRASYKQNDPTNFLFVGDESIGSTANLDPVGLGVLSGVGIGTLTDAANALDLVKDEIEGVGVQLAKLGGNLAELQLATERVGQQVAAGQRGLSRMTDGKMAEATVQLAKEQMRTESNLSLMTQARALQKNLYGVLME